MALQKSVRNLMGNVQSGETLDRLAAEIVSIDSATPGLRQQDIKKALQRTFTL